MNWVKAIVNLFSCVKKGITGPAKPRGGKREGMPPPHTHTSLRSKKKKGKQWKKFSKQKLLRLSPRPKCYCFSHFRASRIQKFFLTILFSVPWHLHFEIHFAGPGSYFCMEALITLSHIRKITSF